MADKNDAALREHLVKLLIEAQAHATFDDAVKGLESELRGKVPKGGEHSPWQLLEHLRIAQWDIVEFSRNVKHESPKWPEGTGLRRRNRRTRKRGTRAYGRSSTT